MTKVTYNNETMTAYLLGSLPEAETEQLDELSFTDDEFAAELMAAEKDLVDAYVHGELRGAKLEQFKTYYLASPVRREKVKFAQAFQEFAAKNIAETAEEALCPGARPGEPPGQEQHRRPLGQLRRLHLDRPQLDPPAGPVDGRADARRQHRHALQCGDRERPEDG